MSTWWRRCSSGGERISSGAIRASLEAGRPEEAADLLGYPWFVTGKVVHGDRRGRELGYPTANLRLDPGCGLRHGIYAVRVEVDGRSIDGVASFGRRPMFDVGVVLLEIFLFGFSGDLYGKRLDVAVIAWIRPEFKFGTVDELSAAWTRIAVSRALPSPAPATRSRRSGGSGHRPPRHDRKPRRSEYGAALGRSFQVPCRSRPIKCERSCHHGQN